MVDRIIQGLKAAPAYDGVLLVLHGAMVVDGFPSGDAEVVRRVRQAMGPKFPIAVTHDFHANADPAIVVSTERRRREALYVPCRRQDGPQGWRAGADPRRGEISTGLGVHSDYRVLETEPLS